MEFNKMIFLFLFLSFCVDGCSGFLETMAGSRCEEMGGVMVDLRCIKKDAFIELTRK